MEEARLRATPQPCLCEVQREDSKPSPSLQALWTASCSPIVTPRGLALMCLELFPLRFLSPPSMWGNLPGSCGISPSSKCILSMLRQKIFQKFQSAPGRNLQRFKIKFKQETLWGNRCPVSDTGQAKNDVPCGDTGQWCSGRYGPHTGTCELTPAQCTLPV